MVMILQDARYLIVSLMLWVQLSTKQKLYNLWCIHSPSTSGDALG